MMNNTNSDEHIIWKTLGEAASDGQQALCIPHPSDRPMALMPLAFSIRYTGNYLMPPPEPCRVCIGMPALLSASISLFIVLLDTSK